MVLDRSDGFISIICFGEYTERLNVALDLMCSFLCKKLFHICFCVKL